MEFSSPCAALQPPSFATHFGHRRDLPVSRQARLAQTIGANSFNFRDLSMKKPEIDYFTLKPARGSSPTASLAADLSRNFHIDQSPQLPTPRRSLFAPNIFQAPDSREGVTTPPIRWEGVTTPPILSSSPGFGNESMDISPLPHKAPFSRLAQINIVSPTPEHTPLDEDMMSLCTEPSSSLLEVPRPPSAAERKKPFPRPSLSRTKGFSTNTIILKPKESQLPAFTFGAVGGEASCVLTPTLDECFTESPPQERKPIFNPLMPSQRPRPPLFNMSRSYRGNGSPVTGIVRKPVTRPTKLSRRSQSVYAAPGDVWKEDKKYAPSGLQSVMDIDDTHELKLPHFIPNSNDNPDGLPRIEHGTLVDVLDGKYNHTYDDIVVVDCRFEFEFEGGHIRDALNFNSKDELADKLFAENARPASPNTLLIFHCEYSQHRAPLMARFVRQRDRRVNEENYPRLTYPEMYILEGGYCAFYKQHNTRCLGTYVSMEDKAHERTVEKELAKIKDNHRGKLSRAHTYTLGQQPWQACQMEDSPTAMGRSYVRSLLPVDLMLDNDFNSRRFHAPRTASY
ncbi:hypothetical protein W97_04715 [Coniosporium apollinis CBS 100218]|uniref:M-phase inducer phosphatase n=1 Tax=Coniosporium apollinis (strain CBS 100218) TaxID=1168221 RepID=R7YU93_CONA1|nr:uncharacterized protein W97_04715 [Coniosporium apollinis CBS 100218]EON65477.1 hypothetical protein W97_04715 [Coniosporium apollinis CBS 100218]